MTARATDHTSTSTSPATTNNTTTTPTTTTPTTTTNASGVNTDMTMDIAVTPVRFLDLDALHAPIRDQLDAVWADIVGTSSFVGGEHVESFERRWAAYCTRDTCIGVANGTDAIELVLAALQVGPGDEVVVPANTFVATAEAVVTAGATPVFVDVDPDTLLMTPEGLEAAITRRTRVALVVHLYGQIPDMDGILRVADAAGVCDRGRRRPGTWRTVRGSGRRAASASRPRSASTRGRTSERSVTPARSSPTTGRSPRRSARWRTTVGGHHLLHTHRGRNSRLDGLQAGLLAREVGPARRMEPTPSARASAVRGAVRRV